MLFFLDKESAEYTWIIHKISFSKYSKHEYFNQLHLRLHSHEEEEGNNRANMTSEWCKTPSGCFWSLTQVAASLHFYKLIIAIFSVEWNDKVSQNNTVQQIKTRRKLKTII